MNADYQRKLHNIATIGTVFAVNPSDQTMRLAVGDNETDWLPMPALAAGQVSVWRCPSVGEQFLLVSPSGELANAVPVVSLYSNQMPSPSTDPNEIFVRYNDRDMLKIDTRGSKLHLTINNTTLDSTVLITGDLQVNGNIHADGDIVAGSISLQNHRHGGVKGGSDSTGAPR